MEDYEEEKEEEKEDKKEEEKEEKKEEEKKEEEKEEKKEKEKKEEEKKEEEKKEEEKKEEEKKEEEEEEEKDLYQMKFGLLFIEYVFLNGKKITLNFHDGRVPTHAPFDFIRDSLKDRIPEDSIFINNGKEFKREEEAKAYPTKLLSDFKPIHIFSESLYSQRKIENKIFPFDNLKILEENESFKIYEYPQKKIEEEEHTYLIALLGNRENNSIFIDGFLNFLFDIKKEDKYRLKLENNNKTKDFISTDYIKSEKGNFKFFSINLELGQNYSSEELSQIKHIFNDYLLSLIVVNKMDKSYEVNHFDNNDYYLKRIVGDMSLIKTNKIFFVEPNIVLLDIIFYYMMSFCDNKFGKDLPVNFLDEFIRDMDNFRQHYYSSFFDFSCIYETKSNNYDLCLFAQLMEGYSIFYESALKSDDYKRKYINLVSYLDKFGSHLKNVEEDYKEYQEKKKIKENFESRKDEYRLESEKLFNVKYAMMDLISDKNMEIEYLQGIKSNIMKNKKFLIPINFKRSDVKFSDDVKNNVCNKCMHICHSKCKCFKKSFCKCMNLKFKCKVCPNKCSTDSHQICGVTFPKYEYRTIEHYFPNDENFTKIDSVDSKFSYIIQKLEEDKKEIQQKIESIKDSVNNIDNQNKMCKVDMVSLNKDLNYTINNYNNCLRITQYTIMYTVWQDELLLYIVKPFFRKQKVFDYIDEKEDSKNNNNNCIII